MDQGENTIEKAVKLYFKLKKSNFSDVQIRKIAQILSACSIDDQLKKVDPVTGEITYL